VVLWRSPWCISGNCGHSPEAAQIGDGISGCDDRSGRLWWRTEISNGTEAPTMRTANGLRRVLVALALTTSLAACSAMSGRESAGEYVDDAMITTKVEAAMFDDPSLKVMQIGVETMQDVVQLSGFVDSAQIKNDLVVAKKDA
jgi:hyperosmotically inducible protein